MSKIALVTGGTRGIGEAISKKLVADGITVIANYASNDDKAKKFSDETGVKVSKWDVSDYESCAKGIENIYEKFGNIDIFHHGLILTILALF